jgi:hypothetical protein
VKPPALVRPAGQRRRTLHDPIAAIIGDLSTSFGKCWATEAGLRRELARRTGYICGERSIGRVIGRAVRRGEWGHQRVKPNRVMANGERTGHGTQHTWIVSRFEQRKARRRAAEEERQRQRKEAKERARTRLEAARAAARESAREEPAAMPRTSLAELFDRAGAPSPSARPPRAPAEGSPVAGSMAERHRVEVARQLAALRAAGLDDDDDGPDE